MKPNRLALLTAALLFAAPVRAQQQPPAVVIQTETRLVLVDSIVTDKKSEYVRDLTVKDFRVWEDNKEQMIKSFSFEGDPASPSANQKHYLVLFFDNSTMNFGEQARAREAAVKFIDANAGPNRLMAIANFGGAVQIAQNFTDNAERLKQVASGAKIAAVNPNEAPSAGVPVQLTQSMASFGARDLILSLRGLAKNLGSIPGRKTLVLLSAGMPLTSELTSEVTATIDMCNRSNVAIYAIDVRGLVALTPGRAALGPAERFGFLKALAGVLPGSSGLGVFGFQRGGTPPGGAGGGGGVGGGGRGAGGGGAPGVGGGAPGGRGGAPGGGIGGQGGRGGPPAPPPGNRAPGVPGNPGGVNRGGYPAGSPFPPQMGPYNQPRIIIPKFPESTATNQQVLFALSNGTGGFMIHETNDLLGGLDRIGKELDQYYILGYTPPESDEGGCHVLRVKVDRGGLTVRSRTGYCNAKPHDLLTGTPMEKQLETRLSAPQAGTIPASMQAPYFYTSDAVARVDVALDIAAGDLNFEKQKGKFHADVHVLGVAYREDGGVGARFSDTLKLDLPDKKQVEQFKQQPLHYENQFDIAPGSYRLKVVFTSGGSSFGKLETPLAINAYDNAHLAVSSLALSKQALRVADAGIGLDSALIEDRIPMVSGDFQVIPTGSAQFEKGEPALFYVEFYEPHLPSQDAEHPLAVGIQLRVLDRVTGEAKADTGMMRLNLPKDQTSPVIRLAERMPVDKIGPGSYVLELTAQDSAEEFARRTASFDMK